MLTPYPESFPTESITDLIGMIKNKAADKEAMGLAIWNLQGYAQSKLLSNNPVRFASSSNPNPSDEDAIEALNVLDLNSDESTSNENMQLAQMNPMLTVALSTLLKWVLNRALNIS